MAILMNPFNSILGILLAGWTEGNAVAFAENGVG
jgi:hypothetical protein